MTTLSTSTRPMPRRVDPPPLANGDRMMWDEFERRWDAMPNLKNAELINGVVYMAAALRIDQHGRPHHQLSTWLGHYCAFTPGLDCADNATLLLDAQNAPQPDGLVRIPHEMGGQSSVSDKGYLEGAPELAAEVSASTTSIDLHDKLRLYERYGVREYIVWRVLDDALDWFVLERGRFIPLPPDADGLFKSRVFPGLWLDAAALLVGDLRRVFAALDRGLATPEHAEFVKTLVKR